MPPLKQQKENLMNLKQLLNRAGIRNDIIQAVERKKLTPQQELEVQEKAAAMTKMMINEALRGRQAQEPPVPKKKTIIIPD